MRSPRFPKILLGAAVLLIAVAAGLVWFDRAPLVIESEESKTIEGGPVFNKIRWFTDGPRDIWMMSQSHHGRTAESAKWDRLAIVVDRSGPVPRARFYQFEPGPLEWSGMSREVEYRVSCMMCHSNGPRAIRPDFDSSAARISAWDRARVFAWNMRVKTYGRILTEETPMKVGDRELQREVPLRLKGGFPNEPLNVRTCTHCHKEEGLFARGQLTRQQIITIRFMVEEGHMPPPGFSLSEDEKNQLARFAQGL